MKQLIVMKLDHNLSVAAIAKASDSTDAIHRFTFAFDYISALSKLNANLGKQTGVLKTLSN